MGDLLVRYAMQFVGTPYLWGGNNPVEGFDCSGLAIEILNAFGFKIPDQAASDLYLWCLTGNFIKEARPGALVFFGKDGKIGHVGIVLNRDLMIDAGGGGSDVTSKEAAAKSNAFVRIRPMKHRKDLVAVFYPPYSVARVVV